MRRDRIKSLADLLIPVMNNENHKFEITSKSSSFYLDIFLADVKENNDEPTPYDRFSEDLFQLIPKDGETYPQKLKEFIIVWTAWVELYRSLKKL